MSLRASSFCALHFEVIFAPAFDHCAIESLPRSQFDHFSHGELTAIDQTEYRHPALPFCSRRMESNQFERFERFLNGVIFVQFASAFTTDDRIPSGERDVFVSVVTSIALNIDDVPLARLTGDA
jgi:hypothetical protein